jgi:hypothetical protein
LCDTQLPVIGPAVGRLEAKYLFHVRLPHLHCRVGCCVHHTATLVLQCQFPPACEIASDATDVTIRRRRRQLIFAKTMQLTDHFCHSTSSDFATGRPPEREGRPVTVSLIDKVLVRINCRYRGRFRPKLGDDFVQTGMHVDDLGSR